MMFYPGGGSFPGWRRRSQRQGNCRDEKIKGVDAVSPKMDVYLTFGVGKYVAQASVIGIKPEVMQKFGYELQEGKTPGKGRQVRGGIRKSGAHLVLQSEENLGQLLGRRSPGGCNYQQDDHYRRRHLRPEGPGAKRGSDEDKVVYKEYKARGVGILANPNDESAYNVYMSWKAGNHKEGGPTSRKETISIRRNTMPPWFTLEASMMWRCEQRHSRNGISDKQSQRLAEIHAGNGQDDSGILGGIGAISLLVAALGITNTMIMSIYERTKEIGIMKVIGANLRDIKKLFLLEAGMIGFIGGVIGLIFSLILSC
jgi:hypothetical protein